MQHQNKDYEIEFFNVVNKNSYELTDKKYYEYLYNFVSKNRVNLRGKMLEAGCGTGVFGKYLLNKFPELQVTGLEIAPNMVKLANDKTKNYHAISGDLDNKDQFNKEQFDFILCPFVLHHFPDLEKVTSNLDFWLKEKGTIIIMEPNGSNIINKFSQMNRKMLEKIVGNDFLIKRNLVTPNETSHEICDYKKVLNSYNIISINSDFLPIVSKNKISSIYSLKNIVYKFQKRFSKSLSSGSFVVIIAQKK